MPSGYGTQLKEWRRRRGVSQLALSARAGVSQRHVSFLETGRSRPSREMVLHLAAELDVPLREQNILLAAAGYPPAFRQSNIEDAALAPVRETLDFLLRAHLPYMAVVVDRLWNVVASNEAAGRFMAKLFPMPPAWLEPPLNLMRLSLHPEGLRKHMVDWERSAAILLRLLEGDAHAHPSDRELGALFEEVRGYPGLAGVDGWASPDSDLLVPLHYVIDGTEVRLFTSIATLGTWRDALVSELRIETFFPADEESDRAWRDLVT